MSQGFVEGFLEEMLLQGSSTQAAGVCAFSRHGDRDHVLLVQYSNEQPLHWGLPQGEYEAGDSSAFDNALRVCEDETAHSRHRFLRWDVDPIVIRMKRGAKVLRSTLLYAMSHDGDIDERPFTLLREPRHPDQDEDTTMCQWFPLEALNFLAVKPAHKVVIEHFLSLNGRHCAPRLEDTDRAPRRQKRPLGPLSDSEATKKGRNA
jgi:hypothetical protein